MPLQMALMNDSHSSLLVLRCISCDWAMMDSRL